MLQKSEYLVFITKYLNNPTDEECQKQLAKFRSASPENETYFLEMEKLWSLSESAAKLEDVNQVLAVKKLKQSIRIKTNNWIWFRAVAVSILLIATGYWVYYQTTKVNYLIKTTAQNQIDAVKLVDGSEIILAANSELKYPDKFGSTREISLIKGQAFFKIAKDPKHPFKISMHKSSVVVLGTSFNIKLAEGKIDLGVITGQVFFTPDNNGTKSILSAGQGLCYDALKKEFVTKNAQNANSWLTKELIFVDTPLEEVCKQLTDYYKTEIKLNDNKHTSKKLNATFKNQSLAQVLAILNETYNIKIKKQKNQINLITP